MSYDINQSQGPYFDGKNQLPGQPPLDQPVSPDQVFLSPDDPTMKKYSSHYEFPLSMLMAIMLHVFAVLLVLAYMAIKFYFSNPPPPDMDTIVFAGGGGQGDNSQEEIRQEVKQDLEIKLDPIPLPDEVIPDKLPDPKLFEQEAQKKRLGDVGKGGEGSGGGKGKGIGTGIGDGAGAGIARGARLGRPRRWTIKMSYEDPEAFLEKLSELKIIIGAAETSGRFLIFKDMPSKPPVPYQEMDMDKFQKFAQTLQQIWFISNSRLTCNNFAEAVGLSLRPSKVFMFIPQDMENAILAKELKHHGLSEDEIKKRKIITTFDVRRSGSGWDVKVLSTGTDPSLNYDDLK